MRRAEPSCGAVCVAVVLTLFATACGGGTSVTELGGPEPPRCGSAISPATAAVGADGGPLTITVSAARECAWTAATDAAWLRLSATSGQGDGTVVVTAAPNPFSTPRSAGVRIDDRQLTITQAARACSFELRPSSVEIAARGGSGTIAVNATDGCAWQASTTDSWVRLPGPSTHVGSGSQDFEATANDGAARDAIVRIADQEFRIAQAAHTGPPPGSPLGPAPPASLVASVRSDTSVELRWTNSDAASETYVYRDGAMIAAKAPGVTSHQDTGLRTAATYTYVVRHARDGITGLDSNAVTARPVFFATGGSVSNSGGFRQHVFTSSGTFVVTQGGTIAEIVIVGAGGGGGGSEAGTDYGSGGGGAGGVRVIRTRIESPGSYAVVVGQGGQGGGSASSDPVNNNGAPGGASSYGSIVARGGGGGAGAGRNYLGNRGGDGGSGGGGSGAPGGAGTAGEGNAGGSGAVNAGGAAGGGGGGSPVSAGSNASGQGGPGGPGYATWYGMVASGGDGGRGTGGSGGHGGSPGDGGDGNGSGGSGGTGAGGVVLIRYVQ